ncbi:MAG: biosynthetic arginine decarboxylase [Bacteroidota bacterium]|nr:biosynthetic arginine decarboxylase [Bacteroidota bacterium]
MQPWHVEDAVELYNIAGWGAGYFGINEQGNVVVRPRKERGAVVDLKELVDELLLRDITPPVLVRFMDILGDRIEKLCHCFQQAADEYGYRGHYYNVYPIRFNQQRPVVEEIVRYGRHFNVGLEAGSKPELHAVLGIVENPEALIVCNGYKDSDFVELALLAQKMGRRVFLVVEKLNELQLIATIAERVRVQPNLGIRIKLSSAGSGRWEESAGEQSKFGLSSSELLEALELATACGLDSSIRLIHFHLGSQITNIRRIKSALREAAQFYVQLRQMGYPVEFVDVGGGLGVDYDGTRSSAPSSANYSIQEYANDVISALVEIASQHGLPHPHIITEAGRALTAHHCVLIFNVLEVATPPHWNDAEPLPDVELHPLVHELYELLQTLSSRTMLEAWHDAQQYREQLLELFNVGLIDLRTRALGERLFWTIARQVYQLSQQMKHPPEELRYLPRMLADKYFVNFSLFQSLPDAWAVDQLFPVMPIHRLTERPTRIVTLQDITCDSDGHLDRFACSRTILSYLPVHELHPGEAYYIGVFLVGAYQEILGDLHNLFGDTNTVHVRVDGDFYRIEQVVDGETVADVLGYVQFNPKRLVRTMEAWVSSAVKEGRISVQEGREFLAIYRSGLYGYTYLE